MKKIIAAVLTAILAINIFCFSAGAAENTVGKEKAKLLSLYDAAVTEIGVTGKGIPYGFPEDYFEILDGAERTVNDNSASYDDVHKAYEDLHTMIFDRQFIHFNYAVATYKNALKETNDNGWYTEAEWNEFQDKLTDLKAAIDATGLPEDYDDILEYPGMIPLTDAFHALLKTYNTMTNRSALAGDVDGNGKVNINDATMIQRYIANLVELNGAQKMRAALSEERKCENITIKDVTQLQQYVAEFTDFAAYTRRGVLKDVVFIEEMESNPLETKDYLTERVFNFSICPRNDLILYDLPAGYRSTALFMDYIDWYTFQ